MSKYEDRAHVASKISWEGGIYGWLGYGCNPADMPDDELKEAAHELRRRFDQMEDAAADFMALLPDLESV